jgi:predicted DNA-binding protein (MmcQ/YjbR family)
VDCEKLKDEIMRMPLVNEKPMFGYQCFSANGKFFVGFNRKNSHKIIVRLPKEEQQKAPKHAGIKPFSHGAKAGWIEIDLRHVGSAAISRWVKKGYDNAMKLAKSKSKSRTP